MNKLLFFSYIHLFLFLVIYMIFFTCFCFICGFIFISLSVIAVLQFDSWQAFFKFCIWYWYFIISFISIDKLYLILKVTVTALIGNGIRWHRRQYHLCINTFCHLYPHVDPNMLYFLLSVGEKKQT